MDDERIVLLEQAINGIKFGLEQTKAKMLHKFRSDAEWANDVEEVDDMIEVVLSHLFR